MGDRCATKYPVMLIHGAGFRDLRWPVYWGRIPGALEAEGAELYYGKQDGWTSIETNAAQIAVRINEVLLETGAEKVNIIAHSKGGLDSRRAVTGYGCADKVASITTVGTPHHGSKTIDRLLKLPKRAWGLAAFAVKNWSRVFGDKMPDFLRLCRDFTTERMAQFNEQNPNAPGVYYQSVACVMNQPMSDFFLSTANFVLNRIEGPNDGLVSVESAKWGERCRVLRSSTIRGISHMDAIDMRRMPFSNLAGKGVSDICDVYVEILEDLKQKGY